MNQFWDTTPLKKMTDAQWESLCDHCGLCCLQKVIYEEPFEVAYTSVACRFLDLKSCNCISYQQRSEHQPECVKITIDHLSEIGLMPRDCAYLRVYEGRGLPEWHPLISGNSNSVHQHGVSLKGKMISEVDMEGEIDDYLLPESESPNDHPAK